MSAELATAGCETCRRQTWRGTRYWRLVTSLDLGHDEIAHRIYCSLLRAGVISADQLVGHSDKFLRRIPGIGRQALEYIRRVVPEPAMGDGLCADGRTLRAAAVRVLDDYEDPFGPLARALYAALEAAAEDVEWAERQNRKNGGGEAQLPSATAEALLKAAQIYMPAT